MFDVDKFIECIHERPALWEKTSKDYSDKKCRERSWTEIGKIMYENWEKLELAQRDEKVKEMKNKWRHIRDNFLKFVNQGKNCSAAPNKKKKYVYADALTFLLDTVEKRKTSGNVVEDYEEKVKVEDKEGEGNEVNYDEEEGVAASATSNEPGTSSQSLKVPQTRYRQRSMINLSTFQNEQIKKLENSSKQEEEDADKSFLMSLLPDYRKLNYDEKLDFRLLTLHFFRDIRRKQNFQNLPPGPSTQSCYPLTQVPSVNPFYQFQGGYPLHMQAPSPMQSPVPIHRGTGTSIPSNHSTSAQDSLSNDSVHSQASFHEYY